MTMMDAIAEVLWSDAAFQAACPGGIAAGLLPEGATLPACTYLEAGGASDPTFDTSGMQRLRLQFDTHAADRDGAWAAVEALCAVLNGYRGVLADGTNLQAALQIAPPQSFYDNDPRQFRYMAEFYLLYNLNF